MATLSINSNIASMSAQRRLAQNTQGLQSTFARLSSGLRINRPADDAAGLSVASSLKNDSRVYAQAIRNVNDTISLHNIAEGAMTELSNVLTRIAELAEQAGNGTLSFTQRKSLDAEGQALRKEYNRIVDSVEFNNMKLIDGSLSNLSVQAGYDALNLAVDLNTSDVGDGTFKSGTAYGTGLTLTSSTLADFNGDGILDIASVGSNFAAVGLGNGDGTFKALVSTAGGSSYRSLNAGDFNGDGYDDLVVSSNTAAFTAVLISNGNGTFLAPSTLGGIGLGRGVDIGDMNGDGNLDLVFASNSGGGSAAIAFGNGNGSFRFGVTFASGGGPENIEVADVNSDGYLDMIETSINTDTFNVHLGNGNGTFKAYVSYHGGDGANSVDTGDFNGDGMLDVLVAAGIDNLFIVSLGNGDGTFKTGISLSEPDANYASFADINGDDYADVIGYSNSNTTMYIALGNGGGSFTVSQSFAATTSPLYRFGVGDVNGDGSVDIVTGATGATVFLGNNMEVAKLQTFSLLTQDDALRALDLMKRDIQNVALSIGVLGANQSRLSTTASNLIQSREGFDNAASQILDADVAQESSNLVRYNILQQAAASVLAQANQLPALALKLLQDT